MLPRKTVNIDDEEKQNFDRTENGTADDLKESDMIKDEEDEEVNIESDDVGPVILRATDDYGDEDTDAGKYGFEFLIEIYV